MVVRNFPSELGLRRKWVGELVRSAQVPRSKGGDSFIGCPVTRAELSEGRPLARFKSGRPDYLSNRALRPTSRRALLVQRFELSP